MKGGRPRKPTGTDAEAQFQQTAHDKLHGSEGQIRSTPTVRVDHTSKGIFLHARQIARAGAAAVEGMKYRGPWVEGTTYETHDVVIVVEAPTMFDGPSQSQVPNGVTLETFWLWPYGSSSATPKPAILNGYAVATSGQQLITPISMIDGGTASWVLLSVINMLDILDTNTFNGTVMMGDKTVEIKSGRIVTINGQIWANGF